MYRFYCVVSDQSGQRIESSIAEVAVGCGAKNNQGEWLSFMCFNLGADHNISINDQITRPLSFYNQSSDSYHYYETGEDALYGDLFQWGRVGDGHQRRQSATTLYSSLSDSDLGNGNQCYTNSRFYPENQIKPNTTAFGNFIIAPSAPNNWYHISTTAPDNLWRAGIFYPNDPCAHYRPSDGLYQDFWNGNGGSVDGSSPACSNPNNGWRLPTQTEWGEIYRGGTLSGNPAIATANTWSWVNPTDTQDTPNQNKFKLAGGFQIMPDNATTTLFLPTSGRRGYNDGLLYYQGQNGFYWSSTAVGDITYSLHFYSGHVDPAANNGRSYGFALRCIKNT
jgi:uncharacterized protein (TIGR02145 family)